MSSALHLITKNNSDAKTQILARCSDAVHDWVLSNGLALNTTKSEVIVLGTSAGISTLNYPNSVSIAGAEISIS